MKKNIIKNKIILAIQSKYFFPGFNSSGAIRDRKKPEIMPKNDTNNIDEYCIKSIEHLIAQLEYKDCYNEEHRIKYVE